MAAQKVVIRHSSPRAVEAGLAGEGVAEKRWADGLHEREVLAVAAEVVQAGAVVEQATGGIAAEGIGADQYLHARKERFQWYALPPLCGGRSDHSPLEAKERNGRGAEKANIGFGWGAKNESRRYWGFER